MYRTHVVPHQYIPCCPTMAVLILRLSLMFEQKFQDFIAFGFGQLIDAHGVARVGVKRSLTSDWMR